MALQKFLDWQNENRVGDVTWPGDADTLESLAVDVNVSRILCVAAAISKAVASTIPTRI